ncbi:MAG: T9SS type B sorting domain-containing protein [Capnocytophaga sp.]|nr:T9SS type B sorting domain-containing protein [Capnocytophaga sp.]
MKKVVFFLHLALFIVLGIEKLSAQNYENFVPHRYQETVKGDMLLVGNSILNVGNTRPANSAYTGSHSTNSGINLQYADVDGIASTFNSSSAKVTNPNTRTACLKVKKAYLYWAAAYTQERVNNQTNPRLERSKFGQVKFKTPNQAAYASLTGERIYDGNHIVSSRPNPNDAQRAYVYMADVTSYVETEAAGRNGAFDGDYTVADMMAPYGNETTGVGYAAGWTLIIIYEDQMQPSRHITLFDGFSAINNENSSLEIPITGFQTIPSGSVRAKFAFAALEGELGIPGDMLQMRRNSTSPLVSIDVPGRTSTGSNPNFFNSQITNQTGANLNRNPASTNLLGFDAGIFDVPNAGNSLIANGQTSVIIRPSNRFTWLGQDAFFPFIMAFNVEVIAPVIDLEKKVYKVSSNADVTGGSVNLGDVLRYEIQFRNSGNDNARDLVITDKLPNNLIYNDIISSVRLSWDSTPVQPTDYEYNATTHEIKFKIPNNIVQKGQTAWHKISFEVQVPPTCNDLRDACSNEIANIVNARYFGVENKSTDGFTAESVVSHKDCEGNLQGPSTFIADLGTCASQSQEVLCERTLNLVAGANFDTYVWYKDGVLISGANAQTLTVSESGTYRVEKKKAGCADMAEIIQVRLHDAALAVNPINQYASEVLRCGNDGSDYPQIYLCGTNSSRILNLNVNGALSYKWERRSESCAVPPTHPLECPVRDNYGCSWTQVHAGNSYNVSQAGDYRVEITYNGGCVALFYFKVTKILLDPVVEVRDMICGAQGRITVTHPAAGYEYALRNSAGTQIQGYQDSNTFTIANPDSYVVLMRQKLAAGATYSACVFEVRRSVIQKDPVLTVVPTPLACANSKGTLRVQVTDAYPPYTYTVRRNNATGAIVAGATATSTSDITFTGLDDGLYYVGVTTPECSLSDTKEITKIPPVQARVTIKSHLMCNGAGVIRVDAWDGTPGTSYGYSIDGGATYFYNYTGSFYEFTVSNPGTYTIKVVDANGCDVTVVSDPIRAAVPPTFATTTRLIDCGSKGAIEFTSVTNPEGYFLRYSVDGGTTSQLGTVFTGLNPGATYTPTLIYSTGSISCTVTSTVTLPPATSGSVMASAGVAELIGCGSGTNVDKARVRITNVRGGQAPYQFSFDGGATWTNTREMWLLPGTYTVIARDAVECEHRTQVVVDPRPVNPVFTHNVTYNCDGTGNISIANNQSTYTYTYTLGGVTTTTSNFNNLPPGEYTITIGYGDISSPTFNELFLEDFGVVPSNPTRDNTPNTTTPYINSRYFFEVQSRDINGIYANHLQLVSGSVRVLDGFGNPQGAGFNVAATMLNDGEYVVTNRLEPNNPAWRYPNDPSGYGPNGRMLFVNVGDILGSEGAILYQRVMNDVLPNQPIEFSIKMFNLINATGSNPGAANPDLTVELYTSEAAIAANTPIFSQYIGSPPKSTHSNDWYTYSYQLNPGNNTTLYAVLRSGSLVRNGNDVVIDDIHLYQLPRMCSFHETVKVTIEPDKAFGVGNGTSTDILCNDANNGTYQVALRNTATTGYWVSRDGAPFVQETANPFVWTGIGGGAHTVTFRYGQDTAHCEVVKTFTINNPSAIVIAPIADVHLGCNPASVNLTIVASGGIGALRYAITQPDGTTINQNTPNFTITQAGTHSLTVTDANNCPATVQFNVIQAPTPTVAVAPTSNYCVSAGTQARIDVTVTNGTAPFTYAINGSVRATTSDANYSFAGLTPGTYTMTVTDSYGCVGTLVETIQPELRVNGAAVEKEITCDPVPVGRGIIKVSLTGGYAPYQYAIIKDGTQTVVARTSVGGSEITYQTDQAGVYTIRIYDNRGCETSTALTLTAPVQPTITYTKTDINCYGESTGAIVVNVSAGAAPYQYSLNGVNRGSQNTFNNLIAGTYTITVTDAKNCETSEVVTITQPTAPLAIRAVITKLISCDPTADRAEVSYSVSGGTPNYNDNQGGANYGTETRTISLGVGTHNITVTDANGCQTQTTVEVPNRPAPPTVSSTPTIAYNCEGNGSFTLNPTPATFDYTYTFNGVTTTTNTFTNVPPGVHQIGIHYVQNNVGGSTLDCGYTMTITVTVADNQEFKSSVANVVNASCAGVSDGQITLNVQNYGSGYTYSVDGGASQNGNAATLTIPNLSAGTHTITLVYDTCTVSVSATITEPESLVVTPTITVPAKCNNNQRATVTLQVAGGTAPYSYTFGGVTRNSNVFTQVPVGTHTFTVTDRNGCSTAVPVVVEAPKVVTFTATPTACYSGNSDAEIVVTVTGGNGDYRFSINNGAWQTPASTSSLTYTFTGLPSSSTGHIIRVEDGFGCQSMTTVVIYPRLVVSTKETSVSCHNGRIEVTASGGNGTYQYAFVPSGQTTGIMYGNSSTYTVTTAGAYDVYVQSAACVYSTTVTVAQATTVSFTATVKEPNCSGYTGSIGLTNIVGDAPYTLNLYNTTAPTTPVVTVPNYINTEYEFVGLTASNTYIVAVTDRYGCVHSQTLTINDKPQLTAILDGVATGCVILGQNVPVALTVSQTLIDTYAAPNYKLEYSIDGTTWNAITATVTTFTDQVGNSFTPQLRVLDAASNIVCLQTLDRFVVPFPLSELAVATDLETGFTGTCTPGGFTVLVTATGGISTTYHFTMDDPTGASPNWQLSNVPGRPDQYRFQGLTPGRTYVFYVRDASGCIQQNEHDIYENYIPPVKVVGNVTPICFGAGTGSIDFVISRTATSTTTATHFNWVVINKATGATVASSATPATMPVPGSSTTINVSSLPLGTYYMEITEIGTGCEWASADVNVYEQTELNGTPRKVRDITCETPGLLEIENPYGGGGTYVFELTSPAFTHTMTVSSTVIQIPMSTISATATSISIDVRMIDQYGCDKYLGRVNIGVASPTPTPTAIPNSCVEPLSIRVTPTGANYQYAIRETSSTTWSQWQVSEVFTNLTAGTYEVALRDISTGCVASSTAVTLYTKIEAEVTQNALLGCGTTASATIQIKASEGSGNYEYAVSGATTVARTALPSATYTLTAAVAGTYVISLWDADASASTCPPLTFTVTVAPPVYPAFTASTVSVTCHGYTDGMILINEINTGAPTVTYTLVAGSPTAATYSSTIRGFAGLSAGAYTVRATSANGCATETTVTVEEPDQVFVDPGAVSVTQFGCASGNSPESAVVTIDPTKVRGGTPPYSFVIAYNSQTVTGTTLITNDHTGGTVTITVTDANACTPLNITTTRIERYDALTGIGINVTNPIACGTTSGETVDVLVTSVANNPLKLQYVESATTPSTTAAWQPSRTFTNLAVGLHTFWVRHIDTGCMTSVTHEVKEPNTFTIDNFTIVNPVVCIGSSAVVTFEIQNTATYTGTYNVTVPGTPITASRIGSGVVTLTIQAGTYTLSVTQASHPSCTNEYPFTVPGPTAGLTATVTVKNITCVPGNDGAIEVINVTGGWGGYEYRITPATTSVPTAWGTNPLFNNLAADTYRIEVRDSGGCVYTITQQLSNPTPIVPTLAVSAHNCVEGTGVLVATASGGEGNNYSFQLIKDGVNYGSAIGTTNTNTVTFSNLSSGQYEVVVFDTWGCVATLTTPVVLYEPITNANVRIDKEITCTSPQGANVTVLHQGGNSGNITYVVTPPSGAAITQSNNPVFTNLATAGVYTVTVTDNVTGCPPVATTFELTATINATFTYTQTNVSCNAGNDGSIGVIVDNTQTQLDYVIRVTSTVVGFTTQSRTVTAVPATHYFNGLSAGTYVVTLTSARGCVHTETVNITEPTALGVTAAVTTQFACDASNVPQEAVIQATVTGGTAPFNYSIDGTNFNNTTGTFTITDTGVAQNITVYVKDANGCEINTPITVNPLPKITSVNATQVTAVTCQGPEVVRITIAGGSGAGYVVEATSITGSVVTPATQTLPAGTQTADFNLPEPGQYEFKVTDTGTGCYTTTTYVVNPYNLMTVTVTPSKAVSCAGTADGEVTLRTVSYTGTYTWEVLDANTLAPLTPPNSGTVNSPVFAGVVTTTITGLPEGQFIIRIVQQNTPFCTVTSTIVQVATPGSPLTVTSTLANPLTCAGNDAVINAQAQGGWGEHQYRLDINGTAHPVYGTYTTTAAFAGLSAGNYTIWAKDKEGCETSTTVVLQDPTPITVSLTPSVTTLACYGDKTASVTATLTSAGGSGNYKYILLTRTASGTVIESGAQDSPTFTGLGAGEYAVRVIDGWDCDAESAYITIAEPTQVQVQAAITQPLTCLQQAQITVTGMGGSGTGYVFTVASSTGTITPSGTGVYSAGPGRYVFTAVDGNGCPSGLSNVIEIYPIEALGLNVDTTAAYVKCNGDSSATIQVEAYGGLGNYQYELLNASGLSLTPPVTNTDGIFTGLATGTYNVKVTSVDCEYTTTTPVVINEAPPLVVVTATSTNETCFGENDGTINVEVTGGTGTITYAISPRLDRVVTAEYIRAQKFEPGNYVVIAQDANGCTLEFNFNIIAASQISVTLVTSTDETCLGSNDGTATITVTGGVAPYSTAFNDNSPTANWVQGKFFYDNLPAGQNHTIFVKDANGCIAHVIIPEIKPGVDLQLSAEATPECTNNNNVINNRIVVSVNPLHASQVTYALDGGTPQSSNIFNGVTAGVHTVTVSHTGGCVQEVPVTMPHYDPLSVVSSTTEITCNNANDGVINFQVTGGSASYTYTITPAQGNFDPVTQQFTALPPGNYTVAVRDNVLGCMVTGNFNFVNPDLLTITAGSVSETCYGDNDGQIQFTISGGRPTYSYVLTNAQGQTVASAGGIGTGQQVTQTGLAPGTYVLTYVDQGGVCTQTETIQVGAAPNLQPVSLEVKYECTATTPSNYLEVVFDNTILNQANTFYALNSTNIADAQSFTEFNGYVGIIRNLPVGSDHYITIFYNSCSYTIPVSQYFDVEDYEALTLQNLSDPQQMNQIKVQASGGKAPYTYYFNGKTSSDGNEYYVSLYDPGYTDANGRVIKQVLVTVVDDLGCTQTLTIEKEFVDIYIPNYFTPNGDGNNDGWSPRNTRSYPNIQTDIFDRYGRKVATIYYNETWDGKYQGRELPTGDYWYIVRLKEDRDDSREFMGHFTLFR